MRFPFPSVQCALPPSAPARSLRSIHPFMCPCVRTYSFEDWSMRVKFVGGRCVLILPPPPPPPYHERTRGAGGQSFAKLNSSFSVLLPFKPSASCYHTGVDTVHEHVGKEPSGRGAYCHSFLLLGFCLFFRLPFSVVLCFCTSVDLNPTACAPKSNSVFGASSV